MTKKILSILMVCALAVCMCIPAFAAEPSAATPYAAIYTNYKIRSKAHSWHGLRGNDTTGVVDLAFGSGDSWTIGRCAGVSKLYLTSTIGTPSQMVVSADSYGRAATMTDENAPNDQTAIEFYTIQHNGRTDCRGDIVHITFTKLGKDLRAQSMTTVNTAPYNESSNEQKWKLE